MVIVGAFMKQTLTVPAAKLIAVTIYLFESTTAALFGKGQNCITVSLIELGGDRAFINLDTQILC